jgi:hypothetical protein
MERPSQEQSIALRKQGLSLNVRLINITTKARADEAEALAEASVSRYRAGSELARECLGAIADSE